MVGPPTISAIVQTRQPMKKMATPQGSAYSERPLPSSVKPAAMVSLMGHRCTTLVTSNSQVITRKPLRATTRLYQMVASPASRMVSGRVEMYWM